ncbi:MAG: NADH-quinone oxidoreductase subunit NuoK [Bacteriovoracaceae bacterium]|nr:NADH-quinone oxidoreductase subunit NuoK [Bacteriovoracaceae bacterium]
MISEAHLPQILALFLFVVGMTIVLLRRNTIVLLMGIELMLNAANLSLVAFSRANGQLDGQVMVFFVITIAAAESAVGLSILVNLYRNFGSINTDRAKSLQG